MRLPHSLLLLSSLSLVISSSLGLQCYSTLCEASERDEHGFCLQTCRGPNQACYGTFFITPNHTVVPGTFLCHAVLSEDCVATTCQLNITSLSSAFCCCRSDRCNIIGGLFGDITPAPPIVLPTPSVAPPPTVPGNQLVCEYNNCTTSTTNCYHGYQNCSEHGADPADYFCAVHATRNPSGLYELQSKGCEVTANLTIHSLGAGQTNCLLDTASSSNQISCYCDTVFCNNASNLVFTDASRFIGVDPDVRCESAGCSHSCVISNGAPRCLCRQGYALDADSTTCVDINECLDVHQHLCSHICVNTDGSYECECPPDSGLRLTLNGTHCEPIPGLVCASRGLDCHNFGTCGNISYCDRVLYDKDATKHVCTAVVNLSTEPPDIQIQSCFAVDHYCDTDVCNLRESPNKDVYSCCCKGNLCNTNINYPDLNASTEQPPLLLTTTTMSATVNATTVTTEHATSPEPLAVWSRNVLIIVVIFVIILSLVLLFIIIGYVCHRRIQKKRHDDNDDSTFNGTELDMGSHLSSQLLPRATHFENPPIGSGRFSIVYKERFGGEDRAVKVFQRKDKNSYDRELVIYREQNFKHSNILLFITNNEFPEEVQLIFEYHPKGSLYDVLKKTHITMEQFCDIAISSARGLAYLHTEIHKDGAQHKSCIAHRDLKSKNILIKSDGTACISDFGLAIKWPIEVQNEAQGQVGTARYMAPEVLEGAISFDREAYFRIDVYAFSLILWELTSRTKTLNGPVSDYRPPFDEMVPQNPSIEDMRKVVVDRQKRPTIPKVFTNQSEMDDIVYTIQETWDKDADARLSAQCVYERLTSFVSKFESTSKDSGFTSHQFDSVEPLTSSVSGSPTNTVKPPLEASTTMTDGAEPNGYPNTTVPLTQVVDSAPPEVMSSNHHRPITQNGVVGGGVNAGPRPQGPTGGNPMVTYPQRPSYNMAPPLHAPGEFHYRFVQAPSFPRHLPPSNNSYNQQQPPNPDITSARELNNRNSREIPHPPVHPTSSIGSYQCHMESTV